MNSAKVLIAMAMILAVAEATAIVGLPFDEIYAISNAVLDASLNDAEDCAKKLVCSLNAQDPKTLQADEITIATLFGKSGVIDVTGNYYAISITVNFTDPEYWTSMSIFRQRVALYSLLSLKTMFLLLLLLLWFLLLLIKLAFVKKDS